MALRPAAFGRLRQSRKTQAILHGLRLALTDPIKKFNNGAWCVPGVAAVEAGRPFGTKPSFFLIPRHRAAGDAGMPVTKVADVEMFLDGVPLVAMMIRGVIGGCFPTDPPRYPATTMTFSYQIDSHPCHEKVL